MQLTVYCILVVLLFQSAHSRDDESALCRIWSNVEKGLQKEFHVTCTKSKDCSGLNCSGVTYGNDINSRIQLYACENPPSLEFQVNVPKLGINNFKKRIYHNDSITLTKNLDMEFELERKNKEFMFGLYVHYLNNGSFPLSHITIPVISPIVFPVDCLLSEDSTKQPSIVSSNKEIMNQPMSESKGISVVTSPSAGILVSETDHDGEYSNCSIKNSTCGEEEMCKQLQEGDTHGICVCISNYARDINGRCIYSKPKETSSVSLLLTAILVPIFVILIILGAVYASIRFRVCQHLRRRLRVQVYEHVLLGEDEEEDLTNPVA